MAVEGRMKYVKFLLFSFNIVFLLYGLAFLMVGVVVGLGTLSDIGAELCKRSSIVCIVTGIITLLIAFFGLYGAWKENYCMITTFVILQSLYLIIELLFIIGLCVLYTKLKDQGLEDMVREYRTKEMFKDLMDQIQQESQCCGAVDATDWVDFQPDGISVPDSCCWNVTLDCGAGSMFNGSEIYTVGCRSVLENIFKVIMLQFGIPVLVIVFMEILDILLACTLMYGIRKGYSIVESQKNHFQT